MLPASPMNLPLPPKRWEDANDPRWDSIRHRPWFRRLLERKRHIPALKQAYEVIKQGHPQWKAAAEFGVDERELRDFILFHFFTPTPEKYFAPQSWIDAINYAYDQYQFDGGRLAFHAYLMASAKTFGLNPRAVRERWEIDPNFLPSSCLTKKGNNEEPDLSGVSGKRSLCS